MGKEKIIGIDLGTSNSEGAVMLGGKPTIIPSADLNGSIRLTSRRCSVRPIIGGRGQRSAK